MKNDWTKKDIEYCEACEMPLSLCPDENLEQTIARLHCLKVHGDEEIKRLKDLCNKLYRELGNDNNIYQEE